MCALAAAAVLWCFKHGYILYWGDAQAHLNVSRSIIDSRTPGYDQLGTVWLPLLHLICLPLVGNNWLWTTGLAGSIPVAACFVVAGLCFYLAARHAYRSSAAALVVLSCFALNPNVLYLASIPMTEVVFFAGLGLLLLALLQYRNTQHVRWIAVGVVASWFTSLTRYDGWFLIPFAAVAFRLFARHRRWSVLAVFGVIASFAPLYWLVHNRWETGNALDFYNGPYSASAIQAGRPYRGYRDWKLALQYYGKAGELCAGWPLILLGIAGVFCAAAKKTLAPVLFLALTPLFYVWSMHSSGATPIHVPQFWPHSYYNTRYGIAVELLAAFAAGAIVLVTPIRWRRVVIPLLLLVSISPWILNPSKESWICWKESQVNSDARRAWTAAGAEFLKAYYQKGDGILTFSGTGDVAGIFCRAGIPLAETLNIGNGPAWLANTSRPDLLHQVLWAVAQAGDPVALALDRAEPPQYRTVEEIQIEGAVPLRIYRREAQ